VGVTKEKFPKEKVGGVKVAGIPGACATKERPGIPGALGIAGAWNVPVVELKAVGTLGIGGAAIVTLMKLGIGGGPMLVKLVKLVTGKNCKLLVFSTPRRDKVAGFCCSIRYDTRGSRGRYECESRVNPN
jgi:hypothetical protein